MKLNQIIFPHVSDKKQKKETQFMFCYNIFLVDHSKENNNDYLTYKKSLSQLIKLNLNNNLVGFEDVENNMKTKIKNQIEKAATGNSARFSIKFIPLSEKQNMDNYLAFSGWKKKIDKYSFITEGCLNDEIVFLGGKNEMMLHYCKFFPFNPMCTALKKKLERSSIDQKLESIFGDPERADKLLDGIIGMMDNKQEK
jgi:hypothetical protein